MKKRNKVFATLMAVCCMGSMAMGATAVGADGLIIEVHNNPARALCDGAQSLTPAQFDDICHRVNKIREALI